MTDFFISLKYIFFYFLSYIRDPTFLLKQNEL